MSRNAFDELVDVVVVGSGAAAMVTALAAKESGLSPVITEATAMLGGNSAISGGGLWIPNNHVIKKAGQTDSYEEARRYLDLCVDLAGGDIRKASSPERRHAYLTKGPEMVQWLEDLGMQWVWCKGYADYYPERPGGKPMGRGIEAKKYNIKRLGKWADKLRYVIRVPLYSNEASKMAVALRTLEGFLTAARIIGLEATVPRLVGKQLVGLGNALTGRLLEMLVARRVPLWLSSPLKELIIEREHVVGAVVEREGKTLRVGAARGMMLASGGFERNAAMRKQYQEAPITDAWTSGTEGNTGHPIEIARGAGAALALMDDAWWGPTVFYPDTNEAQFMVVERSLPFGFIVAKDGKRFMNESESYVEAGHHMYERNRVVEAIPAWQILDSRHRRYYPFGFAMPGKLGTRKLLASGAFLEAHGIEALARTIGVDVEGLVETTRRFNEFARTGRDLDFHRGESAFDRKYSDPRVKPNPNLGPVEQPPFYAVKVYPGDLGTKGGVVTDEHARVLREDGSVIEGLYAAGNCSASVMGRTYPGAGSTLGPAMTFAYIGARHMAQGASTASLSAA